jgi:hypothetical protein
MLRRLFSALGVLVLVTMRFALGQEPPTHTKESLDTIK